MKYPSTRIGLRQQGQENIMKADRMKQAERPSPAGLLQSRGYGFIRPALACLEQGRHFLAVVSNAMSNPPMPSVPQSVPRPTLVEVFAQHWLCWALLCMQTNYDQIACIKELATKMAAALAHQQSVSVWTLSDFSCQRTATYSCSFPKFNTWVRADLAGQASHPPGFRNRTASPNVSDISNLSSLQGLNALSQP